jgi:subtilisin family serine protease
MKLFAFSCVLYLSIFATVFGQVKISASDRDDLQNIIYSFNQLDQKSEILKQYPINKIGDDFYLSFLGKINNDFSKGYFQNKSIIVGKPISSIVSVKIKLDDLASIDQIQGISYLSIASKINNQLDKAVKDMHADSVQQGIGLPQGYTGKNVYIGVTDWGFDYTSPVFYDTLMTQSRIVAAWDQFKLSGPHPNGFPYGTEYNTTSELLAAGSDTSNIYSYGTHGTHVASIAGGAGAGTNYRGVAYEANFLFVTFLVDESAVLDAWEWMYQKAQADGKRLVINMSWGLYHFGTLDGNSMLSQAITAYSNLGVVFANSGGNNGNVNFHLKKVFDNNVLKSKVDFYSYGSNANMWGQSIHAWGEVGNSFSNGIIVTNSSNAVLVESPYYSTASTPNYIDSFLVTNSDTIWYNISADQAHPLNNKPQMRLRVKNTNTSLKVLLKSQADTGIVHYWNVTELTNDVGNWGMPFSFSGSGTVSGDADNGISEPSCSDDVISVAAYATQYATAGGSLVGGAIASFSSHGPRYDGVMKPDIAAPGVSIASAISSFTNSAFTSVASVSFNNTTYHFAKFSGTSMSSPMVAGVAALILQANPYLSASQVKEIIKTTARQDNFTGVIVGASPIWGAGKINAYTAVKLALSLVGTNEIHTDLTWSVYPNPVSKELHFTLLDELPNSCDLITENGTVIPKQINLGAVNVADLAPGKYWIRLRYNDRVEQDLFIKN